MQKRTKCVPSQQLTCEQSLEESQQQKPCLVNNKNSNNVWNFVTKKQEWLKWKYLWKQGNSKASIYKWNLLKVSNKVPGSETELKSAIKTQNNMWNLLILKNKDNKTMEENC